MGESKFLTASRKLHWWRVAVSVSFAASILRSGLFAETGSSVIWYALQFGPIVVASVLMLTLAGQKRRPVDTLILLAMIAMVLASGLSAVASSNWIATLSQAGILALMFAFFAITYLRRWTTAEVVRGDLALVFVLICAAQLIGLLCALLQLPFVYSYFGRFTGLFSNANYAGMLASLALPLAVYLYVNFSRRIAIIGAPIAAVALVMSGSRGALVAAGVGIFLMVFFLPLRKRLIALGAFAVVGAMGLLLAGPLIMATVGRTFTRESQNTDITSGRTEIYEQMVDAWADHPWTGYGYHETDFVTAGLSGHNTYLSTLTETGVFGAVAMLVLLVAVLVAGPWRGEGRLMLGAVAAAAILEATESAAFGWGGPTALITWIIVLGYAGLGRARWIKLNGSDMGLVEGNADRSQHA